MTGRPSVPARAGVALATRLLPRGIARARYRDEFLAELHDLPPTAQLRHVAVLLLRGPALRAALEEDVMDTMGAGVPFWRCRVLRWHDFVRRSNPDGGLYQACRRCGRDRGPAGYGPMTTPPWPVGSAGR
jgi:hypothetical protein